MDGSALVKEAVKSFKNEIENRTFPQQEHTY
jgi:ketopantoate hydroxymethyltransferase